MGSSKYNDMAADWTTERSSSITGRCKRFYSSLKRPDWLWCSPSLQFNGYHGIIPGGEAAGAWTWPFISIYAEFNNGRSYTSTPPYALIACRATALPLLFITMGVTTDRHYLPLHLVLSPVLLSAYIQTVRRLQHETRNRKSPAWLAPTSTRL